MFEQNAQFIYAIYGSLIIANLFLLGVGRLGLRLFCKVVQIPSVILYPIIIFTCVMGAYLAQYAVFDVTLMLCFSLLAYFMRKFDYSFICLIIGFILAPIWETSLQQVIIASEQDPYMVSDAAGGGRPDAHDLFHHREVGAGYGQEKVTPPQKLFPD